MFKLFTMLAIWFVLLVLIGIARGIAAGPQTYNANSDHVSRTLATPPTLGAAGYQFSDPVYGSPMLRVTDANTRPDKVNRAWASPSSAETAAWSTDSSYFVIQSSGGGEVIPYSFNPSTMVASRLPPLGNGSGGLILTGINGGGFPDFSKVSSHLLYYVKTAASGQNTLIASYDLVSGTETVLHDANADIPGLIAGSASDITVSSGDTRLAIKAGGTRQNTDFIVFVWDRVQGARWLNMSTGVVGGAWGPTGAYTGDKNFATIHNLRISKDGNWVRITTESNAGMYFWNVPTLTLTACTVSSEPPGCGGHAVTGVTTYLTQRGVNQSLASEQMWWIRPMSNILGGFQLNSFIPSPYDSADEHESWNNVNATENNPVVMEVFRPDNVCGTRPWDCEIIALATDGSGTIWRFAQHQSFQDGNFWAQPRANVSQDGQFVMFTSNWQKMLGADLNSSYSRTDVFIVRLASPTTPPAAPTNLTVR